MFPVRDVVLFGVLAGAIVAAVLAIWPWARRPSRYGVAGLASALGFMGWNLTLIATNAEGFNVDAPLIGLSWQDAGSGVLVFSATALALGLFGDRRERAGRVVTAALLAGLAAMIFDVFEL